jgi:hypothetical protein
VLPQPDSCMANRNNVLRAADVNVMAGVGDGLVVMKNYVRGVRVK